MAFGCQGSIGESTGSGGGNGTSGSGGSGAGSGGSSGGSCTAADPGNVLASQRVSLLTSWEVINTVRYLIDDTEAQALLTADMFSIKAETERHFPPTDGEVQDLNETSILPLNNLGKHVSDYVTANFTKVSKCATATDDCALAWVQKFAARAYRRQLKADELTRVTDFFHQMRSQEVNCYAATNSVEQSTGYSVWGILMSPQVMWRWEIGGGQTSTGPDGIYLTDDELASEVSFFLTDEPPDDMLLASAQAGMLRTNLASHVSRILQTDKAKVWLRHVMELYFLLNQLPQSPVDPGKFPVDSGLLNSMATESQMFLDDVLWNGKVKDLLLSRTTYVNTRLADTVYKLPAPSGATESNFVKLTLPQDQRSGILTNPGYLTARARSDGQDLIPRAKATKAAFTCLIPPAPDLDKLGPQIAAAMGEFDKQTGKEQAAARAAVEPCKSCHALFDSYGIALEYYDAIARYRTTYDYLGDKPVDGSTTLPSELGGKTINNAVELAAALAEGDAFTNCFAKSMLQYAMTDLSVSVPLPPSGCATADVVNRFKAGDQTFTGLITAVTQSPAFVLRKAAQ